ncbi:MAG TPA: transcription elongation factor GreA [Balneolales bacterium]|nr:transcription elongation factor GreA [Balneolales bacterium]
MNYNYLSKEGYEKIEKELRDLKTRGRKEAANDIAEARAKGDLSENAEYDAAKEAQGMLEKKIAELEHTLATSRIIDDKNIDSSKVYILSTVTIFNRKTSKEMKYTIVAPQEADFKQGKISNKSPIGEALMGKSVGDVVEVKVPAGKLELEIRNIERNG